MSFAPKRREGWLPYEYVLKGDVCITTQTQQFCHNLSGHAFPLPPLSFPHPLCHSRAGGNPGKKMDTRQKTSGMTKWCGCPTGTLGHDKIICHSREGGNPVFSIVSCIPARVPSRALQVIRVSAGMTKKGVVQSCRRVEESVIENRKELLHIVK